MLQIKRNKAAFTLIELLVVVIIVAVLAAVGIPLLSANVDRARMTEAETGLGTIRTALRAWSVENTTFPASVGALNFVANDLLGQFMEIDDYTFQASGTLTNYCITAIPDAGGAEPNGGKVAGKCRSMDEFGTVYNNFDCNPAAGNVACSSSI